MSDSVSIENIFRAEDAELVLMVLGFLAAETSSRPNALHFNLSELNAFSRASNVERLDEIIDELVDRGLVTVIGGRDSYDLIEEGEFKISPSGILLLVANKFKTLFVYEKYAPDYLEPIELFFRFIEADDLFRKKWNLSGFSEWSEKQSDALEVRLQEIEREFVPAAGRQVTLNHNLAPFPEFKRTLEQIIVEFKKDHRLDNELGKERAALEKALEGALVLIEDVVIELDALVRHVTSPLQRIAEKYDQAIVGALAIKALELLEQLIRTGLN